MSATTSAQAGPRTGRRRILDEAAGLFLARGYAETSIRDIAAAANLQVASLYHHFASKDELLTEVMRDGIEAVTLALAEARHRLADDAGPRELLAAAVRAHLGALFEHGPFTAANVTVFHLSPPEVRAAVVPLRDAYEQEWEAVFGELAATGALRAGTDLGLTRLVLLGAVNSTLKWFDPDGNRSLDDLATAITDTFWAGIAAPGVQEPR